MAFVSNASPSILFSSSPFVVPVAAACMLIVCSQWTGWFLWLILIPCWILILLYKHYKQKERTFVNNCCQIFGHLRNRRHYSQRDHLNSTFQGFMILVLKAKCIFSCSSHCDREWEKSRKRPFKLIIYLWWLKHYRKMHACFFSNHCLPYKNIHGSALRKLLKMYWWVSALREPLFWLCGGSRGLLRSLPPPAMELVGSGHHRTALSCLRSFFRCCDLRVLFQVTHHMCACSVCGSFPLLESSSRWSVSWWRGAWLGKLQNGLGIKNQEAICMYEILSLGLVYVLNISCSLWHQ